MPRSQPEQLSAVASSRDPALALWRLPAQDVAPGGAARGELIGEILDSVINLTIFVTHSIETMASTSVSSNNEIVVLTTLRLDGPRRPRDLVQTTGLSRGGISSLLNRLEDAGLIERRHEQSDDRRAVHVQLTADGSALVNRIAASFARSLEMARPIVRRVHELLDLAGFDVGPVDTMRANRGLPTLRFMRRLGQAGTKLTREGLVSAFGLDDPAPHRSFAALRRALHSGGTRPADIMDATGLSSAGTTELLDRLEASGLVERLHRANPDHRVVTVTITPAGHDIVRDVLDATEQALADFASTFFPR